MTFYNRNKLRAIVAHEVPSNQPSGTKVVICPLHEASSTLDQLYAQGYREMEVVNVEVSANLVVGPKSDPALLFDQDVHDRSEM